MNWVGGSRSRLVMKNDAKRQREFFEKRKMQQRLKSLGLAMPASPKGSSSGSMDLMTLFIVNQIAAKKGVKDPPEVAVLGSSRAGSRHKRNESLVLPMSPCSPSQLSLAESQPQYSFQGPGKRQHVIPQGFKFRQLSPVLESAFSDNSASDYLPPMTDPLSPFSSTSSASSGQGMFHLLPNLQQRIQKEVQLPPPPPMLSSTLGHLRFQPFSQHRGITDSFPSLSGSNPPLFQLETPTAAKVLFGSSEAGGHGRHEVSFSFHQLEDRESSLDFTLNQSEMAQQMEEAVFEGFSTEECEREASRFQNGKSKIYLKEETPVRPPTPQTVPDSHCIGVGLSNCTDMHFSRLENNSSAMNGCDYSPSYSCRGGYLSSDTYDEEECCQPCLQDQVHYAGSLNPNLGSQGHLNQKHSQSRPLTPRLKLRLNLRDYQNVTDVAHSDEEGSNSQYMGGNTAPFCSPQTSEPCKCKKTAHATRDARTQTADNQTAAETCDASTQCSFALNDTSTGLNVSLPPVDVSAQHPATGRQTDTAAEEPHTHTPPTGKRSGGKHTPWSKRTPGAGSLSGSCTVTKLSANNSDDKGIQQRPKACFLETLSKSSGGGDDSVKKGRRENGRLIKDLSTEVRDEVTSANGVNRLSEETETLQEIADILLLLKQREEVGRK